MSELNKQQVRKGFANAAHTYEDAAVVQREITRRVCERVEQFSLNPRRILDLGCGLGQISQHLIELFPDADYFGLDFAHSMLSEGRKRSSNVNVHWICADIEQLPVCAEGFDLIVSTSTLHWCDSPEHVYGSCLNILANGGLMLFSTFGPDTLKELRTCFASAGSGAAHVNQFEDMHTLGDWLLAGGFDAPVVEAEKITVRYASPRQLMKDLRHTGANNHLRQRASGLYGSRRMQAVMSEYEKLRLPTGEYPATYEVIYAHARKSGRRVSAPDSATPVTFYR